LIDSLDPLTALAVAVLIFLVALLYSCVGFAGGSGYLAVMGIFNVAPDAMKPAALFLNVLVASVAAFRYYRAGSFSWKIFWPLGLSSTPMAFLGGYITLPAHIFNPVVGAVLLFAAYRLVLPGRGTDDEASIPRDPASFTSAAVLGGGVGFLSGLTGVGGGIFLSPALLHMRWAEPRLVAGISAMFILVNSVAGLTGSLSRTLEFPGFIYGWAVAAIAGGMIGSGIGSAKLGDTTIKRLLGAVLVVAGMKMVLG
jgi:hypothetical protein